MKPLNEINCPQCGWKKVKYGHVEYTGDYSFIDVFFTCCNCNASLRVEYLPHTLELLPDEL